MQNPVNFEKTGSKAEHDQWIHYHVSPQHESKQACLQLHMQQARQQPVSFKMQICSMNGVVVS